MMGLPKRISPVGGAGDLRSYLARRSRWELLLFLPAAALTAMLVYAFVRDYDIKPEYHPNIIYVQSWPLDRSDAEIVAQQKIDQVKKKKDQAELEKRQAELRSKFKKIDDSLKKYGL